MCKTCVNTFASLIRIITIMVNEIKEFVLMYQMHAWTQHYTFERSLFLADGAAVNISPLNYYIIYVSRNY